MHLMWWWQPLLRYFGFPSFLRIWKMDIVAWMYLYSGFCSIRGEITPRTCSLCPSGPE